MRKWNKKKIKEFMVELIQTLLGCIIMAFGISTFLLPNQLSSGGFSGVSTITYYLFDMPIGITTLILNIPLMLFSLLRLGKKFLFKAILGTILLSIFLDVFEKVTPVTFDRLLACIYGGIASGIGTALILKANASTGGTDLISYIIKSYNDNYKTSNLIIIVDSIIIGLNVIIFREIEIALYSVITIYIMGKMIDIIFEGIDFTKIVYIISPEYNKIATRIGNEVNRGSTGFYSRGMFTKNEGITLMCVSHRNQISKIKKIVKDVDPTAFIIITNARETVGKGFEK